MSYDEATPRAAFNLAAEGIDAVATRNPVNSWMRTVSRRELLGTYPPGSALIEIGCGTGADAVFMAEHGCRVAALDISDRMVDRARERATSHGFDDTIHVWRGRLAELADELTRSPWYPFDGAYANFSLTYEASLRETAQIVQRLLKPGSWFVFTLPNKLCISEPTLALARFRIGEVLSRLQEPRWGTIRGLAVRVHAYTPSRVRRTLKGLFEIGDTVGVPVFMPPPYLYDPAFERLRSNLQSFDDRLSTRFPWRLLGDTTLFRARKVGP